MEDTLPDVTDTAGFNTGLRLRLLHRAKWELAEFALKQSLPDVDSVAMTALNA